MKKKGFTLIELLSVIVILAIIALIVTPIVATIIDSAKNAANARSVEGHIKNVEYAIINNAFNIPNDNLTNYDMVNGEIEPLNLILPDRDHITCENYTISNGVVLAAEGCIDGTENWRHIYDYTKEAGAYAAGSADKVNYKITYNLGGGVLETSNPTKYNSDDTFTLNNPTKEGYVFVGWSGTGLEGNNNTSVTIPVGSSGNRTYTANFDYVTYTITYSGGTNATGSMNPTTDIVAGSEVTLPECTFTRTGYTLSKWVDQDNNKYDAGATITVNNDMTLTVEWEKAPMILYDEGPVAGYTWTTNVRGGSTDVNTGYVCPTNASWLAISWTLSNLNFTGYSNFHIILTTDTFWSGYKFEARYGGYANSDGSKLFVSYNTSGQNRVQLDGTIGNIGTQNLNLYFGRSTCNNGGFYVHKIWLD